MKNIISRGREVCVLFCAFFSFTFSNNLRSQELLCATSSENFEEPLGIFSCSIDPEYLETFEPVVFNIRFWQVNDANGNNPSPIGESLVLQAVAKLNIEYNQYNIFFKYRGYGSIDSPPIVYKE